MCDAGGPICACNSPITKQLLAISCVAADEYSKRLTSSFFSLTSLFRLYVIVLIPVSRVCCVCVLSVETPS